MRRKAVRDIILEDVDARDYPDFSDAYIAYACWDTGVPLSEDELDALNEDSSFVYDQIIKLL